MKVSQRARLSACAGGGCDCVWFEMYATIWAFHFGIKEVDIYMNLHCRAKAQELSGLQWVWLRWWDSMWMMMMSLWPPGNRQCSQQCTTASAHGDFKAAFSLSLSLSPSQEARHPAWSCEAILPGRKRYLSFPRRECILFFYTLKEGK